jgi:ABC-type multidrug transport system fused ATPase/permease subunit
MNRRTKQSFSALLRGAWDSTIDERPRLLLFSVLFILAYTLDLLVPWAIGYTLGVFVQLGVTTEAFREGLVGIGAYTLLRLLYTVFHHYARYVQNRVAYSARMNIMSRIFDALMKFPLRWHVGHHSGESLSKLQRSAGAIDSMIGTYIWQIIEGSVKVIFAGVAIFALDFWVATNVLVMSTLTIGAMILFNQKLTARIRRNNSFGNKLNRIVVDYLSNIVTVKTLGVEHAASHHLRSQKEEGLVLSQSISAYMELKWGSTGLGYALVISSSLLIYFYEHRLSSSAIDVAQVYVLLNYLDRIFQAIGSFTGYYSGIIEAATAYEDATELFDHTAKIPPRLEVTNLNPKWSLVSLKRLNFSYIEGEKIGLNNVKFEFRRGEKIALVGQSGSGKSTLLKVMGGLITPESCSLSTDVQHSLTFDDLGPDCLLIPQEPEIFSESVIYNLTMGEDFDSKEVSFFVSLCKIDALISRLPHGLDSDLAQKGLNLSVGEKQRIALARGLLRAKRKEVLLLDEPTSSLDPKTEKEIFLGLFYHFSSRTIISSCHRLNLIPLFDRIVFMASSSVLETGTFGELIEQRGAFYRVWEDYERNIKSGSSSQQAAVSVDMA